MSSVSYVVGDTSWTDSLTCDQCGKKVERIGTGRIERVQLSITDPRVLARRIPVGVIGRAMHQGLPELTYENREFEPGALKGWGSFRIRAENDFDPEQSMDFCPSCAAVEQDSLLERVGDPHSNAPFGTHVEQKYGEEVPALPLVATTDRTTPHHTPAAMEFVPRRSTYRSLCRSTGCNQQALLGHYYCFTHAALEAP